MATIIGTSGNDTITPAYVSSDVTGGIPSAAADNIDGSAGGDLIDGGGGNDTVRGGAGADIMFGGLGNDTYYVDNSGDLVVENAGEGTDTVRSTITYALGASVEKLRLDGAAAIDGTGNELDNTITGNSASNVLDGKGGNDTVKGQGGNDLGVFVATENAGNSDFYDGGLDTDTLRLVVSSSIANDADFQADIQRYEDFLAVNGNPNSTTGAVFTFATLGLKAKNWETLEVAIVDEPADGIVWRGEGEVAIGRPGEPAASLLVGVGSVIAWPSLPERYWTNATGDGLWTTGANWPVSWTNTPPPPSPGQWATFTGADPGGTTTVDADVQVGGLRYVSGSAHSLDLTSSGRLSVNTPPPSGGTTILAQVRIEGSGSESPASLAFYDTTVTAYVNSIIVGHQREGSLDVGSGATLSAVTDQCVIGNNTVNDGHGDGTLRLHGGSTTQIGSPEDPAFLTLGYSWKPYAQVAGNTGDATGTLDASDPNANVTLCLEELNVGWANEREGALGILKWNQSEVLTADTVTFGRGGGTGVLETPAGGTVRLGSAVDPIGVLRIAYNDSTLGTASAALDLALVGADASIVTNSLSIGEVAPVINAWNWGADGRLTMGARADLSVGSIASPGVLDIGSNRTDSNYGNTATGILDASDPTADISLRLSELNIGRGDGGSATGTLVWNQSEAIHADAVTIGRGSATGVIDIPNGGSLHLGSPADPVSILRLAYNDSNSGTARATLDLAVADPVFSAQVADELTIGRGNSEGSLTLGAHSTLRVGSSDHLALLNVGKSVLDASDPAADVELHLSDMNIGYGGSATLLWNQTEIIDATNVYFGRGGHASLDVPVGGTLRLGTLADPIAYLGIGIDRGGADIDFTTTNPDVDIVVSEQLFLGHGAQSGNGRLALGGNSSLTVGSLPDPAALIIGWNTAPNSGTLPANAAAVGVLEALDSAAVVDLHLSDMIVGFSQGEAVNGILRWNQEEAIDADRIVFGKGWAGSGHLEVPSGGICRLGTETAPIRTLGFGMSDASASGQPALPLQGWADLSTTDPTFEAHALDLWIGSTGSTNAPGNVTGSLRLGSNSILDVDRQICIGTNLAASASNAVGSLDATEGSFSFDGGNLLIGYDWYGTGEEEGTLVTGAGTVIDADYAYVGSFHDLTGGCELIVDAGRFEASTMVSKGLVILDQTYIGLDGGGKFLIDEGCTFRVETLYQDGGGFMFDHTYTGSLRTGTLTIGDGELWSVGTFNLNGGNVWLDTLDVTNGVFNFNGGDLWLFDFNGDLVQRGGEARIDVLNGDLDQRGGEFETPIDGNGLIDGDCALSSSGELFVHLAGAQDFTNNRGALFVNGSVDLNADGGQGAVLKLAPEIQFHEGDRLTLIRNDGDDPIEGTFRGLPEGAQFQILDTYFSGQDVTFQISYQGGDGNDAQLFVTDAVDHDPPLMASATDFGDELWL